MVLVFIYYVFFFFLLLNSFSFIEWRTQYQSMQSIYDDDDNGVDSDDVHEDQLEKCIDSSFMDQEEKQPINLAAESNMTSRKDRFVRFIGEWDETSLKGDQGTFLYSEIYFSINFIF